MNTKKITKIESPLRILHITDELHKSGVGMAAYRLHRALKDEGIESSILVIDKINNDDSIISAAYPNIGRKINALIERTSLSLNTIPFKNKRHDVFFSYPRVPRLGIINIIRKINPDIIHIHGIARGILSISQLTTLAHEYPCVMTLHGTWLFTGGCHYTFGCTKYTKNCGSCPLLHSKETKDITYQQLKMKEKMWKDVKIHPIAVSTYMKELCDAAKRFPEAKVIHNCIDNGIFHATNTRDSLRKKMGINPSKKILAFGALNPLHDERKGYAYLRDAIAHNKTIFDDCELIIFGTDEVPTDCKIPVRSLGRLEPKKVAELLMCSDVALMPSTMESFGVFAIEALSCATPVVCFDTSGLKDIVRHKVDGYRAKPFVAKDLARGIKWCLDHECECRQQAEIGAKRFFTKKIAQEHIEFYNNLIKDAAIRKT